MITGDELRTWREDMGMTQQELADRLRVSLRTVGNWERGVVVPIPSKYERQIHLLMTAGDAGGDSAQDAARMIRLVSQADEPGGSPIRRALPAPGRGEAFTQFVAFELKARIVASGRTLHEVAEGIGRPTAVFVRWLNGRVDLPLSVLCEACEFIDMDPLQVVDDAYSRLAVGYGERDGRTYPDEDAARALILDDALQASFFGAHTSSVDPRVAAVLAGADPADYGLAANMGEDQTTDRRDAQDAAAEAGDYIPEDD